MKSTIFKLLVIVFSLILYSCEEEECEEPPTVHSPFSFKFVNNDGINILQRVTLTDKDKSKIRFTREDGVVVNTDLDFRLNRFFLYIIDSGEEPNGEVTKTFYINFFDVLGGEIDDIDTLKFNYELIYQDNRCVPVWFKSHNVFYNDSLYHEGVKYIPSITFLKK